MILAREATERYRSINPDSAGDDLIKVKVCRGSVRIPPRAPARGSTRSEATALGRNADRFLLERPGLALAPDQSCGKGDKHRHYGRGNQYRIDRHSHLL